MGVFDKDWNLVGQLRGQYQPRVTSLSDVLYGQPSARGGSKPLTALELLKAEAAQRFSNIERQREAIGIAEGEQPKIGGWRGALFSFIDNPAVRPLVKAADVLDLGRRGLTATLKEAVDAIPFGDDPNRRGGYWDEVSFSDWLEQVKDPTFGSGTLLGDITPWKWVNRGIGFVGDLALDPLTYVGGPLSVAVKGGRYAHGLAGRAALAAKVLEVTGDASKAGVAARRGMRVRRLLTESERVAIGIPKSGLYWGGKVVKARRIAGTGAISDALEASLTSLRIAATSTKAGGALQRGITPKWAKEARLRLARGESLGDDFVEDLAAVLGRDAFRSGAQGAYREAADAFGVALKQSGIQMSDTAMRVRVGELLQGSATVASEADRKALDAWHAAWESLYDKMDSSLKALVPEGDEYGFGRIQRYFPQVVTPDARTWMGLRSPEALKLIDTFGLDDMGPTTFFNPRRLVAGTEFFGKTLTEDDLTIKALNKIANDGGFVGNFFETDVLVVATKYAKDYAEQRGRIEMAAFLKERGLLESIGKKSVNDVEKTATIARRLGNALDADRTVRLRVVEAARSASKSINSYVKSTRKVAESMAKRAGKASDEAIAALRSDADVLDAARLAVTESQEALHKARLTFWAEFDPSLDIQIRDTIDGRYEALVERHQVVRGILDEFEQIRSASDESVVLREQQIAALDERLAAETAELARIQGELDHAISTANFYATNYTKIIDPEGEVIGGPQIGGVARLRSLMNSDANVKFETMMGKEYAATAGTFEDYLKNVALNDPYIGSLLGSSKNRQRFAKMTTATAMQYVEAGFAAGDSPSNAILATTVFMARLMYHFGAKKVDGVWQNLPKHLERVMDEAESAVESLRTITEWNRIAAEGVARVGSQESLRMKYGAVAEEIFDDWVQMRELIFDATQRQELIDDLILQSARLDTVIAARRAEGRDISELAESLNKNLRIIEDENQKLTYVNSKIDSLQSKQYVVESKVGARTLDSVVSDELRALERAENQAMAVLQSPMPSLSFPLVQGALGPSSPKFASDVSERLEDIRRMLDERAAAAAERARKKVNIEGARKVAARLKREGKPVPERMQGLVDAGTPLIKDAEVAAIRQRLDELFEEGRRFADIQIGWDQSGYMRAAQQFDSEVKKLWKRMAKLTYGTDEEITRADKALIATASKARKVSSESRRVPFTPDQNRWRAQIRKAGKAETEMALLDRVDEAVLKIQSSRNFKKAKPDDQATMMQEGLTAFTEREMTRRANLSKADKDKIAGRIAYFWKMKPSGRKGARGRLQETVKIGDAANRKLSRSASPEAAWITQGRSARDVRNDAMYKIEQFMITQEAVRRYTAIVQQFAAMHVDMPTRVLDDVLQAVRRHRLPVLIARRASFRDAATQLRLAAVDIAASGVEGQALRDQVYKVIGDVYDSVEDAARFLGPREVWATDPAGLLAKAKELDKAYNAAAKVGGAAKDAAKKERDEFWADVAFPFYRTVDRTSGRLNREAVAKRLRQMAADVDPSSGGRAQKSLTAMAEKMEQEAVFSNRLAGLYKQVDDVDYSADAALLEDRLFSTQKTPTIKIAMLNAGVTILEQRIEALERVIARGVVKDKTVRAAGAVEEAISLRNRIAQIDRDYGTIATRTVDTAEGGVERVVSEQVGRVQRQLEKDIDEVRKKIDKVMTARVAVGVDENGEQVFVTFAEAAQKGKEIDFLQSMAHVNGWEMNSADWRSLGIDQVPAADPEGIGALNTFLRNRAAAGEKTYIIEMKTGKRKGQVVTNADMQFLAAEFPDPFSPANARYIEVSDASQIPWKARLFAARQDWKPITREQAASTVGYRGSLTQYAPPPEVAAQADEVRAQVSRVQSEIDMYRDEISQVVRLRDAGRLSGKFAVLPSGKRINVFELPNMFLRQRQAEATRMTLEGRLKELEATLNADRVAFERRSVQTSQSLEDMIQQNSGKVRVSQRPQMANVSNELIDKNRPYSGQLPTEQKVAQVGVENVYERFDVVEYMPLDFNDPRRGFAFDFTKEEWESLFAPRSGVRGTGAAKAVQEESDAISKQIRAVEKEIEELNKQLNVKKKAGQGDDFPALLPTPKRRSVGLYQTVEARIAAKRVRIEGLKAQQKIVESIMVSVDDATQEAALKKLAYLYAGFEKKYPNGVDNVEYKAALKVLTDGKKTNSNPFAVTRRSASLRSWFAETVEGKLIARKNALEEDGTLALIKKMRADTNEAVRVARRSATAARQQLNLIEGSFSRQLSELVDQVRVGFDARSVTVKGTEIRIVLKDGTRANVSMEKLGQLVKMLRQRNEPLLKEIGKTVGKQRTDLPTLNPVFEAEKRGLLSIATETVADIKKQKAAIGKQLAKAKANKAVVDEAGKTVTARAEQASKEIDASLKELVREETTMQKVLADRRKAAGKAVDKAQQGVDKSLSALAKAKVKYDQSSALAATARAEVERATELERAADELRSLIGTREEVLTRLADGKTISKATYSKAELAEKKGREAAARLAGDEPMTDADRVRLEQVVERGAKAQEVLRAARMSEEDMMQAFRLIREIQDVASIPTDDPIRAALSAALAAEADLITSAAQREAAIHASSWQMLFTEKLVDDIKDGYTALGDWGLPTMQTSERMKDMLDNMNRLRSRNVLTELNDFIDKYTRFFKAYATLSMGFHVRNAISNTIVTFMAGADLANMKKGFSLYRGWAGARKEGVEATWIESLTAEQRTLFNSALRMTDAAGGGFLQEMFRGFDPSDITQSKLISNRLTRFSQRAGGFVDNSGRFMLAYDSAVKGMDFHAGTARVKNFFFDYTDTTALDDAMRGLIPFWIWMSRNLPMQIQNQWINPRGYAVYASLMRNIAENDDEDVVPLWLKESGGVKIASNWYLAPDTGFNRLQKDVAELGDPMRLLSKLNPLLRVPIELAGSRKLYNAVPFSDQPEEVTGGPASGLIGQLLSLAGMAERNAKGEMVTDPKVNYALMSLFPPVMTTERLIPATEQYESKALGSRLGWMGVPLKQVTPQMREAELKRRRRAIMEMSDRLKDLGYTP